MGRAGMRRAGAAIAALLVLASCTPSEVDPEARIDLTGTVRRQNGAAAEGSRVALSREADAGEMFAVFASLGLACVDAHTTVCLGARIARTEADGRFSYVLKGRDTQGLAGQASTMVLTAGIGPRADETAGAFATYRFQVQTERLDLPVRVWEPDVDGRTGAFGARVVWTPVPGRVLPPGVSAGAASYAVEFRRGEETVWRIGGARSGFAFDARLLEDTSGTASVVARLDDEQVADELGRRIDIVLRSGTRAYASPLGAPPSRGGSCSVSDADGRPVVQSPCRLTDGELSEDFAPTVCGGESGCVEPEHRSAVVDLGSRRSVSLVVVRGCDDRCTVETSRDARTWRTAGVATSEDAALRISPSVRARHLRVTSRSVVGLREVSVWPGGAGAPPRRLFVDPETVLTPGSPGPSPTGDVVALPDDDGSNVWQLVAVGMLCAVAGALAVTLLGRRGRRGVGSR